MIILTDKHSLRDLIISGKFKDSIQVKNNEHICKDGSIYDYSSIIDMSYMFDGYDFSSVDLFDTSLVINSKGMFYFCHSLISISGFDFSNVNDASAMFCNCHSLKNIDSTPFSSLVNCSEMFFRCYNLSTISLISSKFTLVYSNSIFYKCHSLSNIEKLKFFISNDKILLNQLSFLDQSRIDFLLSSFFTSK